MDYGITVKKPHNCTMEEIDTFIDLVSGGGEVSSSGLRRRVLNSFRLFFAKELEDAEDVIGVSALKHPLDSYRESIEVKSGFDLPKSEFPLEGGWFYVLPEYRRKGIANQLLKFQLSFTEHENKNFFYTVRENNTIMRNILHTNGFYSVGDPYLSDRGHYRIHLYIKR